MANDNYETGKRIRDLRKAKHYTQKDFAKLLGKSERTIQKYESGEIDISLSTIEEIARALDTSASQIYHYNMAEAKFTHLSDIMELMFELERIKELGFEIKVKKPPIDENWNCSISFDGKSNKAYNADMCLFLEAWANKQKAFEKGRISQNEYELWKEKTSAYYASSELSPVVKNTDN